MPQPTHNSKLKPGHKPLQRRHVAILCVIFILLCGWTATPKAIKLEQFTGLEWLFQWRGTRNPPEDIHIVSINSKAAQALQLPLPSRWPRTVYAQLIHKLTLAQANIIVLDIAFRDRRTKEEDKALSDAIAAAGNVILFKYLKRQQMEAVNGTVDIEQEILPPPELMQNALATGSFTLPQDSAKIYHTSLYTQLALGHEATQPLLAYMALQYFQSLASSHDLQKNPNFKQSFSSDLTSLIRRYFDFFSLGDTENGDPPDFPPPLNDAASSTLRNALKNTGNVYINFYGPSNTFQTSTVDQVIEGSPQQLSEMFANKTVYIGYSEDSQTEQRDSYVTVYSKKSGVNLSGVEISATVLANLIDNSTIQPPRMTWWLLIVSGAALLAAVSAIYLKFEFAAALQVVMLGFYSVIALALFTELAVWLPLLQPLLAFILIDLTVFFIQYNQSKAAERQITQLLAQYVPLEAARQLSRTLQGIEFNQRAVSGVCLMTDIKGFTRLYEQLDAQMLHGLMNRYYSVLITEVKQRGGVVANIVGDSLLALWIGKNIHQDLCVKACLTAQAIALKVHSNPEYEQLPTCIALHSGQFSLGNLGAAGHFEYSPVGDIINTTARIEKFNRKLHTICLASNQVVSHLSEKQKNELDILPLGTFDLHNKVNTVQLASFDFSSAYTNEQREDVNKRFAAALTQFQLGEMKVAKHLFASILHHYQDHGPSLYYLSLCKDK